jgi:arsenite-transporting ATPase
MIGRRLYFFGGKGGVGKTTVSSAFSLILARRGKKVLLVSTDPAHSLSDLFRTDVGGGIREVFPRLFATEIDPQEEIKGYISRALGILERVTSPEVLDQIRDMLKSLEHTPGVEEAAVVESLSRRILEGFGEFDCFVVDTAPTGHTLAMLRTVRRVGRWMEELLRRRRRAESFREAAGVGSGPSEVLEVLKERRERLSRFSDLVTSGDTLFVPVVNPEKLSILETERLLEDLRGMGMAVTHLIVNKVLPEETAGEFMRRRKSQEREYLEMIRERFRHLKIILLGMRPADVRGPKDLEEIAKEMEAYL